VIFFILYDRGGKPGTHDSDLETGSGYPVSAKKNSTCQIKHNVPVLLGAGHNYDLTSIGLQFDRRSIPFRLQFDRATTVLSGKSGGGGGTRQNGIPASIVLSELRHLQLTEWSSHTASREIFLFHA